MGETAIKAIARLKEFAAWYRAVAEQAGSNWV